MNGPGPRSHELVLTDAFRTAVTDYLHLSERGYARSASLKLVGDRFRLTATQRSMLFRGVVPRNQAEARCSRLVDSVADQSVTLDSYNVLLTITNYLFGRVLFIGSDGYLRDAGEVHRDAHRAAELARAIELLLAWLRADRARFAQFLIDEPISHSGDLASALRERLTASGVDGEAQTVRSPDFLLKLVERGVIASSDSAVIDHARVPVVDAARHALERAYGARFIDFRSL